MNSGVHRGRLSSVPQLCTARIQTKSLYHTILLPCSEDSGRQKPALSYLEGNITDAPCLILKGTGWHLFLMRKMGFRGIRQLVQGHTAYKKLGTSDPRSSITVPPAVMDSSDALEISALLQALELHDTHHVTIHGSGFQEKRSNK